MNLLTEKTGTGAGGPNEAVHNFVRAPPAGAIRECLELLHRDPVHWLICLNMNFGCDAWSTLDFRELKRGKSGGFKESARIHLRVIPLAVKIDTPDFAGCHGLRLPYSPIVRL
jgi:hypothetical protein